MVATIIKQLCITLILLFNISETHAKALLSTTTPSARITTPLTSYIELRQSKLVRQGWDTSCGAAALATLITYHHQQPVSEAAIALTLLKNTDPDRVRERGGFSLLDLKRYTSAMGYSGRGFGSMTLDDLEDFALPAILPIRIRGFDHFIVYRKRLGDRIFIGDPAFGNLTLKVAEFEAMWQSKIAFYVLSKEESIRIATSEKSKKLSPMSPERAELAIPDMDYQNRLVHRLPMMPHIRRVQRIIP